MFAIRAERDYVIDEDFMKAVRKVVESKKLESKLDYKPIWMDILRLLLFFCVPYASFSHSTLLSFFSTFFFFCFLQLLTFINYLWTSTECISTLHDYYSYY